MQQAEHIGFLLIPEFSMFSFCMMIEPLRMANHLSGEELYRWSIYTQDDEGVSASNKIPFFPTQKRQDYDDLDSLFVIAGLVSRQRDTLQAIEWLKKLARKKVQLGATSVGTEVLANAGLLKDKVCTIHWQHRDSLLEKYPELHVTTELYEIGQDIITCSGGLAGLDLMLQLITKSHGLDLAQEVAELYVHSQIRQSNNSQRMKLTDKYKTNHPRLIQALRLMRNNTEEVMSCAEISEMVGLSTRQMERLFKTHIKLKPKAYYMNIRLDKARYLLEQSNLSILEVGVACGFNSTSYFSRCYRKYFGINPSEVRKS